ncbi:MAG: bifunctional tRNA pseudouridine(32) synthase/23S rRNA pseudouridine(746) synthase RluA [Aliivibrio sp.]|uniref:bifunctional tRNA pseudouridine(32) synthase/23S rRNA pseudouridine(746) synthase RluA n=1 Tax=Aliivibrio sp. TaxID=1872443 RepID=UPI001A59FE43|nr:bifunctional tRNA pseudouridine(32) synthase/23S rRNA pseudouridine(746) synthase RluA [Aliivibrio sp.]
MSVIEYHPPTEPWLEIVYQDEHILTVNKPAGLLSNPGKHPEHYDSVWSRVVAEFPEAQLVHRLDMATSGLMVFALHKEAERHIKKQFQYRLTHKVYYARVWGRVERQEGEIDLPLICDWPNRPRQKVCYEHGKSSQTRYEVLAYEDQTTLIRLLPVTGRSHQLRVHMMELGHPIVGDEFYACEQSKAFSTRLQLHSAELSLYHPDSNQITHLFVPCDFYPEAVGDVLPAIERPIELPDYKLLISS